jgi:hypothetical protein
MGNKARSSIAVNSSTLGSHAVTTLNAADITVSNSITTNTLNTENLVVNGNDVTQFLQSGGSLNATSLSGTSATISDTLTAGNVITNSASVILATGTLNDNTMMVDLNTIQHSASSYTQSSIVNPSPNSHVGFICVSLIDDPNLTGSIALYTRGKMWNLTVYTVIFEKNTNTDSTVSLNTDSGTLTISTSKNITFEIKALNLFEK